MANLREQQEYFHNVVLPAAREMPDDYSRFTALLPALADKLSQALRDKRWADARMLNETIRRKTMSVEAWLNWNVANAADTAAGAASVEIKEIVNEK